MPSAALRKEYLLLAGLFAFLATPALVLLRSFPVDAALFATGIVLAVLLAVYPVFSRRVWVTVSTAGIQGRTFIGRRRRLVPWTEPVVVRHHRPPKGPPGAAVFRLRRSGRPRLLHALFIPEAILRSDEFAATLFHHAPAHHPLRQWVRFHPQVSP